MKKKQDDEFFDEYMQKRKNGCFYSEISSESLLITKIWDFNKTILEKWADINLLIAINEAKTNRKMKKGLKNIANNLREIAHKLDEAAEEKFGNILLTTIYLFFSILEQLLEQLLDNKTKIMKRILSVMGNFLLWQICIFVNFFFSSNYFL